VKIFRLSYFSSKIISVVIFNKVAATKRILLLIFIAAIPPLIYHGRQKVAFVGMVVLALKPHRFSYWHKFILLSSDVGLIGNSTFRSSKTDLSKICHNK